MSGNKNKGLMAAVSSRSGSSAWRMREDSNGFTLVEVIVALTVLSLILLATLSAVHSLGGSQSRLNNTINRLEEMRVVSQFLRSSLRQSMPVNPAGTHMVYFYGGTDELRWAAPLQGVDGVAGLQYMRLYNDNGVLKIQFIPYHPAISDPDWAEVNAYPLLDTVDEFRITYRSDSDESWLDAWGQKFTGLPQALSIRVQSRQRYWPDLIVVPDQYRPVP